MTPTSVTLLAMAPSGETYMARDPMGRVWLLQPPGAGEPRQIEPGMVDSAITKHGFERIDRDFPTWAELDRFRLERVTPPPTSERRPLDLADVERLFGVVQRLSAGGETGRARSGAFALLDLPVVLADPMVHHRILSFLKELAEPRPPFGSGPISTEKLRYHDRWRTAA